MTAEARSEDDAIAEARAFTYSEYVAGPSSRRRLGRFPAMVATAMQIVRAAAPRELAISAVLQVVTGLGLAGQLLLIRELLTELLGPGATFGGLVPEMAGLAGLGLVTSSAAILLDAQQRIMGQLVGLHTSKAMIRTATAVDLIAFENPNFHNRLQRAQLSSGSRPTQLTNGLLGMGSALFAIGGIVIALLLVEPLFCLLVVVGFVPALLASNRASGLVYRFTVEQTERERRRGYLFALLTNKTEAQEIRAFDLGAFFGARHEDLSHRIIADLRVVLWERLKIAMAGQLVTALITAAALALLVFFVTDDRMSIAEATSAAGAMLLLDTRLRMLAGNAGNMYEAALYLEDYELFIRQAPLIEAARPTRRVEPPLDVLEARDVVFSYPSRTEPSVAGVSLTLRRGEVVALVGENGSGKTTLAKMLAGLYSPSAGSIVWNGIDVAELDPVSYRRQVAVIFQDFVRYQLSARENIAAGDHARFDEVEAVVRAARAAGVSGPIEELPQGYETLLGPEFYGGTSFSGGQWQRIALARAFFREAPVVILDEPTAALDPRAEAALYTSMRELYADRAVLLISHRFGSVRDADRIYVLEDGLVTECGAHDELMAAGGHYAELFSLQARQYVD